MKDENDENDELTIFANMYVKNLLNFKLWPNLKDFIEFSKKAKFYEMQDEASLRKMVEALFIEIQLVTSEEL